MKYTIGDVYRELHYIRSAGAGVVVSVALSLVDYLPALPGPGCRDPTNPLVHSCLVRVYS